MKRFLALLAFVCSLSGLAHADIKFPLSGGGSPPPTCTVAQLAALSGPCAALGTANGGDLAIVTDSVGQSCSTGGGSYRVACAYDERYAKWIPLPGTTTDGSILITSGSNFVGKVDCPSGIPSTGTASNCEAYVTSWRGTTLSGGFLHMAGTYNVSTPHTLTSGFKPVEAVFLPSCNGTSLECGDDFTAFQDGIRTIGADFAGKVSIKFTSDYYYVDVRSPFKIKGAAVNLDMCASPTFYVAGDSANSITTIGGTASITIGTNPNVLNCPSCNFCPGGDCNASTAPLRPGHVVGLDTSIAWDATAKRAFMVKKIIDDDNIEISPPATSNYTGTIHGATGTIWEFDNVGDAGGARDFLGGVDITCGKNAKLICNGNCQTVNPYSSPTRSSPTYRSVPIAGVISRLSNTDIPFSIYNLAGRWDRSVTWTADNTTTITAFHGGFSGIVSPSGGDAYNYKYMRVGPDDTVTTDDGFNSDFVLFAPNLAIRPSGAGNHANLLYAAGDDCGNTIVDARAVEDVSRLVWFPRGCQNLRVDGISREMTLKCGGGGQPSCEATSQRKFFIDIGPWSWSGSDFAAAYDIDFEKFFFGESSKRGFFKINEDQQASVSFDGPGLVEYTNDLLDVTGSQVTLAGRLQCRPGSGDATACDKPVAGVYPDLMITDPNGVVLTDTRVVAGSVTTIAADSGGTTTGTPVTLAGGALVDTTRSGNTVTVAVDFTEIGSGVTLGDNTQSTIALNLDPAGIINSYVKATTSGTAGLQLGSDDAFGSVKVNVGAGGTFTLNGPTGDASTVLPTDAIGSSEIGANVITASELADGAVDVAAISASGTPSASTFLRGDMSWQTPAGSGDVTAVGPSCASNDCGTDGVASTGSTFWVQEGTTVDGNEFTLAFPSADPGADVTITFPGGTGTLVGTGDSGTVSLTMLASNSVDSGKIVNDSIDFADIKYTATLASNPLLGAGESWFGSTGIIFEGSSANTSEGLLTAADPSADRTWTLPNADASLIGSEQIDTSSELATIVTDETGSGALVFGTSPTLSSASISGLTVTTSLNIPHSTSLPGTCNVGDQYMDTDATSGQRHYLCESANTWALQGGGGGGGAPTGAEYLVSASDGTLSAEDVVTEGYAIDYSNGAGTGTFAWDPTEVIGTNTFGAGATQTWVWNTGADPDPQIDFGDTGIVINETGADLDLRVEGDTDANLINVDAGLDAVGIGKAPSSGYKLDIQGTARATSFEAAASATPTMTLDDSDSASETSDATIRANSSDPTAGSEDTDLTIAVQVASNLTDRFQIVGTGTTKILNSALEVDASDPADSGAMRLDNAENVCWEASPAGTDVCLGADSSEIIQITGGTLDAGDVSTFVDSYYIPASAMNVDGTQCTKAAAAVINSGPMILAINCTDNAAGVVYFEFNTPDSWANSGIITVEGEAYTLDATISGGSDDTIGWDVSCLARGDGETINSTWGTSQNLDITFATQYVEEHATTTDITPNDFEAGDTLYCRMVIDTATTDTTTTDMRLKGVKVEFTHSLAN